MTEKLLKVTLNTINLTHTYMKLMEVDLIETANNKQQEILIERQTQELIRMLFCLTSPTQYDLG